MARVNALRLLRRRRQAHQRLNMMRIVLGLPSSIRACLFDLDCVLTETATVHVAAMRAASLPRTVVSSSANTRAVLAAAHIAEYFEACIDGVVAERDGLKRNTEPDMYLASAHALGV